jgi:hypothetical protein
VRHRAPHAQLLDAAAFRALWDRDTDIDLAPLRPAHRADFIRAWLLARHGGIWLDLDCVLMRPMDAIEPLTLTHGFVAHRDRQGWFPNGFMAAAPGSVVAAGFYSRVITTLRSGRTPGWIALGGEPLTAELRSRRPDEGWYELPTEAIQPVCWSKPERFFARAPAD